MTSHSPGLWPDSDLTNEVGTPVADEPTSTQSATSSDESAETSEGSSVDESATLPASFAKNSDTAVEEGGKKSKSQRIREYIKDHPEARNRDIAQALEPYGVKAADVANVKQQQKQRLSVAEGDALPAFVESQAAVEPKVKKVKKKAGRKKTTRPVASSASQAGGSKSLPVPKVGLTGEIGLGEVDAAIQFIEHAGGIDRARQIMDLVDRIRQMNIR